MGFSLMAPVYKSMSSTCLQSQQTKIKAYSFRRRAINKKSNRRMSTHEIKKTIQHTSGRVFWSHYRRRIENIKKMRTLCGLRCTSLAVRPLFKAVCSNFKFSNGSRRHLFINSCTVCKNVSHNIHKPEKTKIYSLKS